MEISSGQKPDVWRARLDGMGAVGSSVCMVHCLVVPGMLVLGSMSPVLFLGNETFHLALLWITIPISTLALFLGCRRHRDHRVLLLGVVGFALLTTGAAAPHVVVGEWGDRGVTVMGGLALLTAHVRNHQRCRATCHA